MFAQTISKIKKRFDELDKLIFILAILFGISSWVVFAGIWVESPLLIKRLPEGWALPSMIGAVAQFGQIGPILLYVLKCQMFSCCPGRFQNIKNKKLSDRIIIYALFATGLMSMAVIALFWSHTVLINGKQRSIPFFVGVFFLAILDCTCTIVFLTYIGKFRQNYVTALYIGEGISSLLPSLFALAQGTGDDKKCSTGLNTNNSTMKIINEMQWNSSVEITDVDDVKANFSVSAYFWLLFLTLLVSFSAFAVLDLMPYFKKFRGPLVNRKPNQGEPSDKPLIIEENIEHLLSRNDQAASRNDKLWLLLAITIVSFLLYGFIPGLSSYSTLPYGASTMHLSITLALITQPISSVIATFVQLKTTKQVYILLAISFCITFYIVLIASMSPCPLFGNHWMGGCLMILSWIVVYAFLMYLRCCVTSLLKKRYEAKSLMVCGLLTQVGQFIGSVLIYILVDYAHAFKEAEPCKQYFC